MLYPTVVTPLESDCWRILGLSTLATLNQDITPQKSKDFPVQLPFVLTGCAQLCSYPFSRICQPHMTEIDPSKTYIQVRGGIHEANVIHPPSSSDGYIHVLFVLGKMQVNIYHPPTKSVLLMSSPGFETMSNED